MLMINEAIILWGVIFSSGLLVHLISADNMRKKLYSQLQGLISVFLLFSSLIVSQETFQKKYALFILMVTAYLIANGLILMAGRFHPLRTKYQVFQSSYLLAFTLLISTALLYFDLINNLSIAVIGLIITLILLLKISVFFEHSFSKLNQITSDKKSSKPTVSVAIPARNETHALTQNLRSVLKSKYPRLEVLVHDDCSQDDTSQIIRSFAQDGVRFIQGTVPSHGLLGKNLAYAALANESSGEFILFSGVDTRYSPNTIDKLIAFTVANKLDMLSVMPTHKKMTSLSMVIQPMRYVYLLLSSSPEKPPTLSTIWLIRKSTLQSLGGFAAVEKSLFPERYFAKQLTKNSKYGFIANASSLGLTTFKKVSSQRDTAVRTIYPSFKKSIFNHFLFTLVYLGLVIYPIINLVGGIFGAFSFETLMFGQIVIIEFLIYLLIIAQSYPKKWIIYSPVYYLLGIIVFYYLSVRSAVEYELNRVTWKGRNICYSVMLNRL